MSAQDESDEVVRVRTDLVTIPLFVTDERSRRVSGLAQSDFEVLDNGQRVETAYFAAGAEHVSLLFLLDASGSARDIINEQRETALAVFSRFGPRSRVAVMQFREQPELTLAFTPDLRHARAAFQIVALPDRRTAIFDAALDAVRAFLENRQPPTERRIVVLISDGLDTASATRADAAIAEARAAGVSFYVIHIPLFEPGDGHLVMRRPSKGFRELAEKTGGRYFVVGDARSSLDPRAEHDLSPVFRAIADDLAGQYVLGYHASAAGTQLGVHKVEVHLHASDRRALRVRQLRDSYENRGGDK
ncbi:MAG TPA: VWA domain-containing protein [Pyrinomonadaceae bacterium]|nr:VWA domain-containing protein [Pyrinomonadaceae bacterium]